MAIIDAKRLEADEEAERSARLEAEEYANRHDTAAWQQPPPAYEEAAGQSSSSSALNALSSNQVNSRSNDRNDTVEASEGEIDQRGRSQRRERRRSTRFAQEDLETLRSDELDENDNESTPLLSRRQRLLLKKKLRFRAKYRRACRFTSALLLVGVILIMCFNLFDNSPSKEHHVEPWPTDGRPVEEANWSPIEETSRDTWTSPNVPEYFSTANFSIAANESLAFIRAHGSSYFGSAHVSPSALLSREKWRTIHGGEGLDRIAVVLEAKFTHAALLNSIRATKMIDDINPHKIAEGVSINSDHTPTAGGQFLSLEIIIVLPSPSFRTFSGLARDGSSWIPELQFSSESIRFAFEDNVEETPGEDTAGLSFGKVDISSRIGGITFAMHIRANISASFHVDSGPIRDLLFGEDANLINIAAPIIDLSTVSGPIWLTGIVGIESVSIHTIAGGVNASHIAVAKTIKSSTADGMVGGRYSAFDSLNLHSNWGNLEIDVAANRNLYAETLKNSGLLDIVDPAKVKKVMEEIESKSKFRTLNVQAETRAGTTVIRYLDQDENTLLLSNVTTITGTAAVYHSEGFEGQYKMQTKIGPIIIKEPKIENPNSDKIFTIDTEKDQGGTGRLVEGRLWNKYHKWEEGGSSSQSSFPISHSELYSNIGSVEAHFC